MPVADLSPNTDNYFIGAGIVSFDDGTGERDLGNVSKFEYTQTVTRLPHYSSRVGTRFEDANAVTQVAASVAITMDEFTASNMRLAFLATKDAGPPVTLNLMTQPNIKGKFKLVGTNDVGAPVTVELPICSISPSAAIGFINAGTWGELPLLAEVYGDPITGSFGTVKFPEDYA